jgi:hypothetical protein
MDRRTEKYAQRLKSSWMILGDFEMENLGRIHAENEIEDERHKIIVFFPNDDTDQSIHTEEIERVDFSETIQKSKPRRISLRNA